MMTGNYNTVTMSTFEASPTTKTPFLDSSSSVGTPYTDNYYAANTPPFFDIKCDISPYLMHASFAFNNDNFLLNMQQYKGDDICVSKYLTNNANLSDKPMCEFNGDPSLLLIDKSKLPFKTYNDNLATAAANKPSPTIKLETVTEEGSESLFPPLHYNNNNNNMDTDDSHFSNNNRHNKQDFETMSFDELMGFNTTSPLSEDDDSDFDNFDSEDQLMEEEQQHTQEDAKEKPASRKRKSSTSETTNASSSTSKSNKRSKKSSGSSSAARTKRITKPAKVHQCPLCDHISKRRYNLSTHIKTHDKARVKDFSCSLCKKTFDRRHDRDRHLATVHRGERSFNCQDCNAHFSRKDSWNKHLVQQHDYDMNQLSD